MLDNAQQIFNEKVELSRSKVELSMDRFKTSVIADGLRLEEEEVEVDAVAKNVTSITKPPNNKYMSQIEHRKKIQEHEVRRPQDNEEAPN